jgi:hypothetical protein
MIKKGLLIFVAVMLFGLVGKAQDVPDISGVWTYLKVAVEIKQDKEKISYALDAWGYKYTFEGKWKKDNGGYFSVIMKRTTKSDGCFVMLKVKLTPITDTTMQYDEQGIENKCGITSDYKGSLIMEKQD